MFSGSWGVDLMRGGIEIHRQPPSHTPPPPPPSRPPPLQTPPPPPIKSNTIGAYGYRSSLTLPLLPPVHLAQTLAQQDLSHIPLLYKQSMMILHATPPCALPCQQPHISWLVPTNVVGTTSLETQNGCHNSQIVLTEHHTVSPQVSRSPEWSLGFRVPSKP